MDPSVPMPSMHHFPLLIKMNKYFTKQVKLDLNALTKLKTNKINIETILATPLPQLAVIDPKPRISFAFC